MTILRPAHIAPDVDIATDVFFTDTPAAMCAPDPNGNTPCIRVDVYRSSGQGGQSVNTADSRVELSWSLA